MPRGLSVSVYIKADLYERIKKLLPRLGYRSLSQLINEMLETLVEDVEGQFASQEHATQQQQIVVKHVAQDSPPPPKPQRAVSNPLPEPPCKRCEHFNNGVCEKYNKPITRCMECPKMREYLLKYFNVER